MTRRPLPALIALVALLALTAIVWWRVLNRGHDTPTASASTPSTSCSSTTTRTAGSTALPRPSAVTVVVLNATQRSGIAGAVRTALLKDGFRIPAPAADDNSGVSISQTAQVRYGRAGQAGARLLGYYLPGSVLKSVDTSSATVTVSLGEGYKSVASTADVTAAVARANAGASSGPSVPAGGSAGGSAPGC